MANSGRVRRVGALVAEVAVDLEDPVDSTDDGALEEQLGRDPQVELGVERVAVGRERSRGRTTVHRLQHGGLDLEEAVPRERRAQGRVDRGPRAHDVASSLAHDEVEVAAAHLRLFAELIVQVRQRQDRLRRDLPLGHEDRQLAGAARDDLARHEQVVAEVDQLLEQRERLLADLAEAEHGLEAIAVAGLQLHEAQLSRVAERDDAAREAAISPVFSSAARLSWRARTAPMVSVMATPTGYAPRPSSISRSRLASRTAFCSKTSSRSARVHPASRP